MKIVLMRPWDDKTLVSAYLVHHHSPKKYRTFEAEFDKALKEVKKADPVEWNVSQVIELLEKQGWQIIYPDSVTVTY